MTLEQAKAFGAEQDYSIGYHSAVGTVRRGEAGRRLAYNAAQHAVLPEMTRTERGG
jgi:hypothetical protein